MSSSLRGGLREVSLQPDPLVPHVLVVPGAVLAAWQLWNGECGYQQFTADTCPLLTDSLPAPSLVPQGRGACPWGFKVAARVRGSSGLKHDRTPPLGASTLVGHYKRKYYQHQPKHCLAVTRGPWSHGQKRFWPRGAAATREGWRQGTCQPFPQPSRLLPAPPVGTARPVRGRGPRAQGGNQERPRSRSCRRVSPPPLSSTRGSQPTAANTQRL